MDARSLVIHIPLLMLAIISTQCPCFTAKYLDSEMKLSTWVKNITASSTCGYGPDPEEFCLWTTSGIVGLRCSKCDSRVVELAHSISHVSELSDRWWKSENGRSKVTIDVDLGQEFFITGIILKMGPTPKPSEWVLERSIDSGKTYAPWQYFESSPRNCQTAHHISPNAEITRSDQILCEATKASNIVYEEVVVQLLQKRPGWRQFNTNQRLQNWTRATNIRFRFLDWGTHFGHLVYDDRNAAKTRFYTLQGISIFGRCACYGHDSGCERDSETDRMVCKCEHNTCGPQCNVCCPGFKQHQWQPSRQCQACNCFGHADDCYYNSTVENLKLSKNVDGSYVGGGVCINCKDHTAGINCEHCEDGFYRSGQKLANDLEVCKECMCNRIGSISQVCDRAGGQCRCRILIGGRSCDRCVPEHWGFPTCKPCNCSSVGSFKIGTCDEKTGKCLCKMGTTGQYCDQCPSGDRYLMTPEGCQECKSCSLIQYHAMNEILKTANWSMFSISADWPSKSWVDVRLQWNKGKIKHLLNIWDDVYHSDLNANRRINLNQVKLVKAPLILELKSSIENEEKIMNILSKDVTSLLYRRDAIKIVDGSLAAKTSNLFLGMQKSDESCKDAVRKLREIANSKPRPQTFDDYINEAELLYSNISEIKFGRTSRNCYQERTLSKKLHRKSVILKNHYFEFQQLRKRLNYLLTRIDDIDKRIWDANSNLNSMNSVRRTSARLFELKQKVDAVFKEKDRIVMLETTLIELKKFSRTFVRVIEDNYLSIQSLNENLPKLKESLSKYEESLVECEKYKPFFEVKLKNLHGIVTDIKSVHKNAVENPQQILNNIADTTKMIYLSKEIAQNAMDTLNQFSGLLEQYKNKFAEWFPDRKLKAHTVLALPLELSTDMTDGESSGLFYMNDDDDDNLDNFLLADEVFFENDEIKPKISSAGFRNINSSDRLTNMQTRLQEFMERVQETETTVQRSGEILESALSTLELHGRSKTTLEAQQLVMENEQLVSKTSHLIDDVKMTEELKIKYGKIDLAMRRNRISIADDVKKAFSSLDKMMVSTRPAIGQQPLKSDAFAKTAKSLKEKIAFAKAKAGQIRAPLSLTSPGFVKIALPAWLVPSYSYITTFDIWFNSAYSDAFIFRIGKSSETWGTSILLTVSNYRLELHIHQNRHVWKGRHPIAIQSNRWYRVEMEWVCSQLKVTLTVARGKSHLQEVQLPWSCDLERAFVPYAWIGGLNELTEPRVWSVSGQTLPDMDGCIGELSINEGSLSLFAWEAFSGIQSSCTSSEKDKHHKISGMSIRSNVMQVYSTENELFPPLVEFSFRSTQRNATIVHITDVQQEAWINVKLAEGHVLAEFGFGLKTNLSLPSQLAYNNGQLHHVNVNFTGLEALKQVLVSVNGLDRHGGALFIPQNKPSAIYIGGIPNSLRKQHGQSSLLENFPSFVGCLVGMKINKKTMAISNHSEYLEFSLESCPVRMGMCMCLSRKSGVIRVVRLGYIIDFLGLTFQINNLDSSTRGTILYYTPSPKNHLEIFIVDHYVWVAWKVDSKFKKLKLTQVDDGTWHSILLQNQYTHENSSVLHLDEASVDLPLSLFLGIKYTAQHIVFLGGKALGKTQFQSICYKHFLLNDEMKDFSKIAVTNNLNNCPMMYV